MLKMHLELYKDLNYPFVLVLVGDDNPAFEGLFEFCSISAGGSICMYPSFFQEIVYHDSSF